MFRAARACRRIHRAALAWICYVSPSTIGALGPGLVLVDSGRGVRQTKDQTHAFGLAVPVLRSGTASATYKLVFKGSWSMVVGVFPADQELDSSIDSADGKRCALYVSNSAQARFGYVLCDGERSDAIWDIRLQKGDTVEVRVAFEGATTAHVDLSFEGRNEERTLKDVPACGLRLGVGLLAKDTGVTIVASPVRTDS